MINGTTVIKAKDTATAMEKVVKELGEDCEICYVGHSAGGASPLFTSMYLKDKNSKHVAMSPENCMLYEDQYRFIEKGKFCDRTYFEIRYKRNI